MMKDLQSTIYKMKQRIVSILSKCAPSIYIYGSFVLNNFKLGWSDIDILVLTEKQISEDQAKKLVRLRQTLLEEEPNNPYYCSFEGGMLTLDSFLSGKEDRVVYWGTRGEKITDKYDFDAFCMSELLDSGILIYGNDIRNNFTRPTFDELKVNIQRHYETIRRYVQKTGRCFYSFGWLLDISRCLYTLPTGKIISKTAAGKWVLKENLCPCAEALARAVEVRNNPNKYKNDKNVLDYAETLAEPIQCFADVLEKELERSKG